LCVHRRTDTALKLAEHIFSWFNDSRRFSKDYGIIADFAEAIDELSLAHIA
jgi:hypothetical protein